MDNNRNVIEKFTGELREYISLGHFEFANLPMGSYDFFYVVTNDGRFASEVSPIIGAEDGSGKIVDSCFVLYNQSDKFIFFDGNFNYCLYKLAP